jgi:hypothetical protein
MARRSADSGKSLPALAGIVAAMVFGDGDSDKPVSTLFYTAGFADQTDGVLGSITATSATTSAPATTPNPY